MSDTRRWLLQFIVFMKFTLTYRDCTIHLYFHEKPMLHSCLMNSLINHGSSSFKAKKILWYLQLWLLQVEEVSGEKLQCLWTIGGAKFISTALNSFWNEKGINSSYTALYIHEENGIVERCWRILAIIKDLLLIDSGLLVNFWVEIIDTSNYFYNRLLTRRGECVFISEKV